MKRLLALVVALLVHLMTLGFVVLGAWTILAFPDSLLSWLLSGLCLAIGWVLRPRLGRLPADAEVLGVGLPLWLALPPRHRVTLLATAYAHVPTSD
ncbi:hypothetical protein ACQEVF_56155 [Nonomuraea polychroma]|uniref:hypothetical protein n=1 Tax=Nonomuraea polychroma TaxID=46176 RepID=UPI003D93DB19